MRPDFCCMYIDPFHQHFPLLYVHLFFSISNNFMKVYFGVMRLIYAWSIIGSASIKIKLLCQLLNQRPSTEKACVLSVSQKYSWVFLLLTMAI